jgi:hypothetical protein
VVVVVVRVSALLRARWSGVSRVVFGQGFSCRVAVAGVFVLVGGPGGPRRCSAARGQLADRAEHGVKVGLPRPAGGHPEGPAAAGASEPGRDLKELPAAGACGLHRPVR